MVCSSTPEAGLSDTHMALLYLSILALTWCAFIRISESGPEAVIYTLAGSNLHQQVESEVVDVKNNGSSAQSVTIPLAFNDAPPINDSQHIEPGTQPQPPSHTVSQEGETQLPAEEKETNDTLSAAQTIRESPPIPQEEIPSFNEWAQKHLAEAEKNAENMTGGGAVPTVPLKARHSKNYASTDCGAKVVGFNPNAEGVSAILSSARDEYLLNTCNTRIWFIVELCEAIQPQKIEMANFELFSSSPRDFSVWLTDRYPSRDWALAGRFSAQDVRTVQAFNLSHISAHFGKYVKVEVHSHFGQEHYCPISLFRVYGTSEIEVLDRVDEESHHQSGLEDDDDYLIEGEAGQTPRNLFGSARDAVLSIVKKAAGVLTPKPEETDGQITNQTHTDNNLTDCDFCSSPRHLLVCVNCSDDYYNKVYQLLSCRRKLLEHLLLSSFVHETIAMSEFCVARGLDLRTGALYPLRPQTEGQPEPIQYLQALLPSETLTALCNVIAVERKKVMFNVSHSVIESAEPPQSSSYVVDQPTPILSDPATVPCMADGNTSEESDPNRPPFEALLPLPPIRPSRTQPLEDIDHIKREDETYTMPKEENSVLTEATIEASAIFNDNTNNTTLPVEKPVNETQGPTGVEDSGSLDSLFSELEQAVVPSPRVPPIPQKESVFVRLANRIKALERNMSLSSQYLEELSQRYKKQVEEMQRSLAVAVEERRRGEERENLRTEQIAQLTQQVEYLTAAVMELMGERDSWHLKTTMMGQHGVIVLVEVIVFALVLYICRWLPEVSRRKFSVPWPKPTVDVTRRRSVDEAFLTAPPLKRRLSEEARVVSVSVKENANQELVPETKRKISKGDTRRLRRKRIREQTMQSEEGHQKGQSLLDSNLTESVAGWWENEDTNNLMPPPPQPEAVIVAAPPFVQTAVAQRQERVARSNSDLGEKEVKKLTPFKKSGPFKKIVKKFF